MVKKNTSGRGNNICDGNNLKYYNLVGFQGVSTAVLHFKSCGRTPVLPQPG